MLCACVASWCISWWLEWNLREALLIGLPWGVTAGLLGSTIVHKMWRVKNVDCGYCELCEGRKKGEGVGAAAMDLPEDDL